jgi:tartrate-resistant acid phosphatase type 5
MQHTVRLSALLAVTMLGCPGDADKGETSVSESVADETSAEASGSETGTPTKPTGHLRFVALGDAGEGNDNQFAVADIIEQVCAQRGCDFALYLGDNFYDIGVESVMDEQFQDKFEAPYMDLDLTFYVALGNHDYGLLGNEWVKSQWQVEYTQFSDKWYLPNEYYAFEIDHVKFYMLDTARLIYAEDVEPQREFMQQEIASASADIAWHIGLGHHPYISNGRHGNAGHYDGLNSSNLAGHHIKNFFDAEVCGKMAVYISGHDHDRQWLHPTCGTEFIVSGAGAKLRSFEHRDDNPVYWEDDQRTGFAWIEILDDTMTVAFYDRDGTLDYEGQTMLPQE